MKEGIFVNRIPTRMQRHIVVIMTMLLMPLVAWAEDYPVKIGNTQLTSDNIGSYNGKVTYSSELKKLTLDGATLTSTISWTADADFTVEIKGTNSITVDDGPCFVSDYDIYNITFSCSGENCSLALSSGSAYNVIGGNFANATNPSTETGLYWIPTGNTNNNITSATITNTIFGGGLGTQESPFVISTYDHLKQFADLTNNGFWNTGDYFMLGNDDIDCSGETGFVPIGNEANPFKGHFDGKGKTIKNLQYSTTSTTAPVGMFGKIAGGTVKNLKLSKCSFSGGSYTGAIVGYFESGTLSSNFYDADVTVKTATTTKSGVVQRGIGNGDDEIGVVMLDGTKKVTVNVPTDQSNGVFSAIEGTYYMSDNDVYYVLTGSDFTISATPNEGYIPILTLSDKSIGVTAVEKKQNNQYHHTLFTFKMASADVTATLTFVADAPTKANSISPDGLTYSVYYYGSESTLESEGATSSEKGRVTVSGSDTKVTVTVKPKEGHYFEPSDLTIVKMVRGIVAQSRRRATEGSPSTPAFNSPVSFTAIGTPSLTGESKFQFDAGNDPNISYEVTVNFHQRTSITEATVTYNSTGYTYNGSEIKPNVTVSYNNSDLTVGTDYSIKYENNIAVGSGKFTITGIGKFTGDYEAKSFEIDKATLKVKAEDKQINFGDEAPKYTVKYEGFAGNDGTSSLGGTLSLTCSYKKGDDAKTYTITPSGLTLTNYNIEFVNGTLTVKNTEVAVTAPKAVSGLVYTGKSQTLITKGSAEGGELFYSLDGEHYSKDLPTGNDAGTYTVYYKAVANDANYTNTAPRTVSVRIARAALTSVRLYNSVLSYNRSSQSVAIGNVRAGSLNVPSNSYSVSGGTGTYPGDYTVTVTGQGNFQGTVTASFTIVKANINDMGVTLNPKSATYDGTQHCPSATVKDGSPVLDEGTDYEIAYGENTEAGEGTVTITGKGYYEGERVVTFTIAKADVSVTAPEAIGGLVYNGKAQTLVKEGKGDYGEMVYSTDGEHYGKAVPTGTDAHDYTIYYKVVADKNHNDTEPLTVNATIGPAKLTEVTLDAETLTYNRQELTAKVKAVKAGELDVPAEGYTVGNNTATEAGTYTLTVTGQGNYTGELTADFTIGVADAATAFAIALDPETFTYDGTAKQPKVTVKDGTAVLVEGTDYTVAYANNLNAGEAMVTVTGQGNYSNKKEQAFAISPAALTDVTINPTRLTYNREAQTVGVTGVKAGKLDVHEADYTVSGNTQTAVGTYTVTVTAREGSNFTGEASTTFTIQKADLSVTPPTAVTDLTYNGEAQELVAKGSVADGKMLYSLDGNSFGEAVPTATNAGQYVVYYRSEGDDNYNDYADNRVIVNIARAALTEATFNTTSLTYNGLHQTVEVTGVKAGKLDVPKSEYMVSDNTEKLPGDYTVTVRTRFNSNYQGSLEVPFTIKKAPLTSVLLAANELYYNGEAQTVGVSEVKAGEMDVPAASYTVSGNTQTEAGTYTVTVTATENSNFTGSATAKFSITRDKDGIFIEGLGNVLYTVIDQAKKQIRLDKLVNATASLPTTIVIPAKVDGFEVTEIADGFLGNQQQIADIHLPNTEQPIAIGENGVPGTARIHVSPTLLDDYALMASLQQNVEGLRLSAVVTPANRHWTFSSRINVMVPEGVSVNGCHLDESGTKAVVKQIDDAALMVDGRRVVKAYNGVLMIGTAGSSYELVACPGSPQEGSVPAGYDAKSYGDDNQLKPVVKAMHFTPGECCVLKSERFHPIADSEGAVPEGKAVLGLPASIGSRSLDLVEDTTLGIDGTSRLALPDSWYTLEGRKLDVLPTQPGVYITGGRKVVIK